MRDNNVIRKLAAYTILGINDSGHKEVLSIQVGENESSKYWLSILNELKNRGVKDIMVLCADGLTGIKDSIAVAYPQTEYQIHKDNTQYMGLSIILCFCLPFTIKADLLRILNGFCSRFGASTADEGFGSHRGGLTKVLPQM